jgi:hypothetical protein
MTTQLWRRMAVLLQPMIPYAATSVSFHAVAASIFLNFVSGETDFEQTPAPRGAYRWGDYWGDSPSRRAYPRWTADRLKPLSVRACSVVDMRGYVIESS